MLSNDSTNIKHLHKQSNMHVVIVDFCSSRCGVVGGTLSVLSVNVLHETDQDNACVDRMQRSAFCVGGYMNWERRFQQQTRRSVHSRSCW